MSEISVGIAFRRDSFVHLDDMHVLPRHIFFSEIAKHDPWGLATTHCHDKFAASCNREWGGVGIGIDFDGHQAASFSTAAAFLSPGLVQPPGGVTRATSCGPQV